MRDRFSEMNPYVIFGYCIAAVILTFYFNEPVCVLCSFTGSVVYAVCVGGKKAVRPLFFIALPMMAIIVLVNLFFNHHGSTILFYISNNPSTEEALLYGIVTALIIASVIMWMYSLGKVFDSGKVLYISGRILPMLSLIFAMVMRTVPRYRLKASEIRMAMNALREEEDERSFRKRLSDSFRVLSVLVTWSLESSIDTAVSMKARGYGLRGRTSFLLYRFSLCDEIAAAAAVLLILLSAAGGCHMEYYPEFVWPAGSVSYAAFFLFCYIPEILMLAEAAIKKVKHVYS